MYTDVPQVTRQEGPLAIASDTASYVVPSSGYYFKKGASRSSHNTHVHTSGDCKRGISNCMTKGKGFIMDICVIKFIIAHYIVSSSVFKTYDSFNTYTRTTTKSYKRLKSAQLSLMLGFYSCLLI